MNTWEDILIPDKPIRLSELEVQIAGGDSLTFSDKRIGLYEKVTDYWNEMNVKMTLLRAEELATALSKKDTEKVGRMQRHIGGINPKYRLQHAHLEENRLYLGFGTTNYMEITGTSIQAITNSDFRRELMAAGIEDFANPNHYFANPFAVCTALHGVNEKGEILFIVLGQRSDSVMIYPDTWHVFGGMIDISEGKVNLGVNLYREICEEAGIAKDKIGEPIFHGIIRQKPSRIPEAIFSTPVYVDQDELLNSWQENAPGRFEHRRLRFFSPGEARDFLYDNKEIIVPSGAAALTYLLKHHEYAT